MTSNITNFSTLIDAGFPVAGINQSSQGFRTNFGAIRQALSQGATEITNLQAKAINLSGDATGTSGAFGETSAPSVIALTLATVLSNPGAFNTSTHDLNVTFDAKGRATNVVATARTTNAVPTTVYEPQFSNSPESMGSGTGTVTFPTFRFDAGGRLTLVGTKAITYGLLGHTLARGRLVAGSGIGSVAVPPPPDFNGSYFLVADGIGDSGLSWVDLNSAGSLTGLIEGPGIDILGAANTPTIRLEISTLSVGGSLVDADTIPYYDSTTFQNRRISVANLRAAVGSSSGLQNVVEDPTPELGGNLDVGAFEITSSHPNGIVLNSANGITINGDSWPTTAGAANQVLTTNGSGVLSWTTTGVNSFTNTVFVSSTLGNDTTGNGGIGAPYQTITRALTAVNTGAPWSIVLIGGTYPEAVDIVDQNVRIYGFNGAVRPVITGKVALASSTTFIEFHNLVMDASALDETSDVPAFEATNPMSRLSFYNCDFLRGSGAKSLKPVVVVNGLLSGMVTFESCAFQGNVVLQAGGDGSQQTVISNTRQVGDNTFGVTVGTNVRITNAPQIKGILHESGDLLLENVGHILNESMTVTTSNPPVWQVDGNNDPILADGDENVAGIQGIPIDPTPVLSPDGRPVPQTDANNQPLFEADGRTPIYKMTSFQQAFTTSTTTASRNVGLYSFADSGSLTLNNVNFFSNGSYSTIIKTGSIGWQFVNVSHRAEQDILSGPRITYDSETNLGDFMPRLVANGNSLAYADDARPTYENKLDPQVSKHFFVEMTDDASIILRTPVPTSFSGGVNPESTEMVSELTVSVQQDTTGGHSLVWGADAGPGIIWSGDNTVNADPSAITVYKFYYYSVTRQWVGVKKIAAGPNVLQVLNNASATVRPTLGDAGIYLRLTNDTGTVFEIPAHSSVAYPVGTQIQLVQAGNGKVAITSDANVTINSPAGLSTKRPYSRVTLTKVATNIWDLSGEIEESLYRADMTSITADDDTFTVDQA